LNTGQTHPQRFPRLAGDPEVFQASSSKQQAASKHQASSSKHQAASIKHQPSKSSICFVTNQHATENEALLTRQHFLTG
jgi:hypothetical protein